MSDDNNNPKGSSLTPEDINKLIKSPFEKKIEITKQIADYYKSGGFSDEQMVAAAKIFGTLVKDTEVKIRKTLSEAIKNSSDIPRDIIISLANDVQEVSLPVLQFSDVLTDADLIEIVNSTEEVEKQKTISKRNTVSEAVSEALVETHNEEVVGILLHNEQAKVSNHSFKTIVEDFSDKEDIIGAMIERDTLPVSVVESLADRISDTIYKKLEEKHKDAFARMDDVVRKSRDIATMKVIGLRITDSEYCKFSKLMEKLKIPDELAPIYALCMGNINMFEVKIARLTQTPVLNIRKLLEDSSNQGFRELYKRSSLPDDLIDATEILVTVLRELGEKYIEKYITSKITQEIASHITENIMKKVKNIDEVKNLDYILSLVSHYSSGAMNNAP